MQLSQSGWYRGHRIRTVWPVPESMYSRGGLSCDIDMGKENRYGNYHQ